MAKQSNWRFCNKCHVLWWAGQGLGACPRNRDANGNLPPPAPDTFDFGGHNSDRSFNFELVTNDEPFPGQPDWQFCNKCHALWWPKAGVGRCPAGGGHDSTNSWLFKLATAGGGVSGQNNWRYCNLCHSLWWAGSGPGFCIVGRERGHEALNPPSFDFVLPAIAEPPPPIVR